MHSHRDANTIQLLYLKILQYALGVYSDKGQIWLAYIRGAYIRRGDYIREENHFNLQSVNLTFLFPSVEHIFRYFLDHARCEIFKVNNKPTRIRKVNDNVKNKGTVGLVLASLLLTLNTFHFFLQCFYCWLWLVNCHLGLLFVVLTHCGCWNQVKPSFHLWRN